MDKLILKKNAPASGYKPVMISLELYDKLTELKETTGLSYGSLMTSLCEFAIERVEVQE